MQDTIQEITEKVHILEMGKDINQPYPGRAKAKRESTKPDTLSIGAIIFFILAFSISWMTSMLFMKELVITGFIILMVLIIRSAEQPESAPFEYRQNRRN